MNRLLLLLFLVFPFGQLFKVELFKSANLHALDIICFLLFCFIFFFKQNYKWPLFTRPLTSFWVIASFSFLLASFTHAPQQILTASLYLGRLIVYSSLYFVFDYSIKRDGLLKHKLTSALQILGASIAIFGLIQYLFVPDIRPLREFGWDPHMYRLFGSFLDPAFTGILRVLYLLLLLAKHLSGELKRMFLIPQFLLGLAALYLTYSRASYVAFVAGLAALLIAKRKKKVLLFCVTIFITSLLLLPRTQGVGTKLERLDTVFARLGNYQETLNIALKQPLFGVGFNFYRYAAGKNLETHSGAGADSSLLFVFATTGMIGLLVYMGLWLRILHKSWEVKNLVLFSSSVAVLVHATFSNTLFYPWVIVWIGVLFALQPKMRS